MRASGARCWVLVCDACWLFIRTVLLRSCINFFGAPFKVCSSLCYHSSYAISYLIPSCSAGGHILVHCHVAAESQTVAGMLLCCTVCTRCACACSSCLQARIDRRWHARCNSLCWLFTVSCVLVLREFMCVVYIGDQLQSTNIGRMVSIPSKAFSLMSAQWLMPSAVPRAVTCND